MGAFVEQLAQTLAAGLTVGCMYGLLCVGLAFIFSIMRVINFAQGDLMMVGMFLSIFIGGSLLPAAMFGAATPFVAALLAGPVLFCFGYALNKFLISRTTGLRVAGENEGDAHQTQLILTLGVALMLQNAALFLLGSAPVSAPTRLSSAAWEIPLGYDDFSAVFLNQARTIDAGAAIVIVLCLFAFVRTTRLGKSLRAAAINPEAALYMGIDVARAHHIAFALGTAIAGVAGGLMVIYYPAQPFVGVEFIIVMYAGVVLGGMGSIVGAFWGGLVIGLVQQLSTVVLPLQLQSAAIFVVFVYAVILLVVTPQSVFGLVVSAQAMILPLFGGAGILWGPVIGAAILVPLSEVLTAELGNLVPGVRGMIYGAAIVLIVLLAPEGIYWRLRDLWTRRRARPAEPIRTGPARTPPLAASPRITRDTGAPALLQVRGISKTYGGLKAVAGVSFDVGRGEILGIIGPNGAGKTTLFNLLNGLVTPSAGQVRFDGRNITGLKPNRVCQAGIGRTFQVVRTFARMSVLENVVVGAYAAHAGEAAAWAGARAAVERVGLGAAADRVAGSLTNKELRLLELARALAGQPRLILMDEPLAGLGAGETDEIIALTRALPGDGITVMIIEHTMSAMVNTVDRFIVLDHGELLAEGEPRAVTRDPRVIEAYLGRKWAASYAAD